MALSRPLCYALTDSTALRFTSQLTFDKPLNEELIVLACFQRLVINFDLVVNGAEISDELVEALMNKLENSTLLTKVLKYQVTTRYSSTNTFQLVLKDEYFNNFMMSQLMDPAEYSQLVSVDLRFEYVAQDEVGIELIIESINHQWINLLLTNFEKTLPFIFNPLVRNQILSNNINTIIKLNVGFIKLLKMIQTSVETSPDYSLLNRLAMLEHFPTKRHNKSLTTTIDIHLF